MGGNDNVTLSDFDDIIGFPEGTLFEGGDGDDTIDGGTRDDNIDGGNDNDTIRGRDGADTINGGPGNDTIYGNSGATADTLDFNDMGDILNGGSGDDQLYFDMYDAIVDGGADTDTGRFTTDNGDLVIHSNPSSIDPFLISPTLLNMEMIEVSFATSNIDIIVNPQGVINATDGNNELSLRDVSGGFGNHRVAIEATDWTTITNNVTSPHYVGLGNVFTQYSTASVDLYVDNNFTII